MNCVVVSEGCFFEGIVTYNCIRKPVYLFSILADIQSKINVFIRAEGKADEERNKCKECSV